MLSPLLPLFSCRHAAIDVTPCCCCFSIRHADDERIRCYAFRWRFAAAIAALLLSHTLFATPLRCRHDVCHIAAMLLLIDIDVSLDISLRHVFRCFLSVSCRLLIAMLAIDYLRH